MKNLLIILILPLFLKPGLTQQNYEWAFTTNQFDRCNDFSDGLAIVKEVSIEAVRVLALHGDPSWLICWSGLLSF